MIQRKKVKYFSKNLPTKLNVELIKVKFDVNDSKFVGVALQSNSKYIIIEADIENWMKIESFLLKYYSISILDCKSCFKTLTNN